MELEKIQSLERKIIWFVVALIGVVLALFIVEQLIPGDNGLYVVAIFVGPFLFGALILLLISWIREMRCRKSILKKDILIGVCILVFLFGGVFL